MIDPTTRLGDIAPLDASEEASYREGLTDIPSPYEPWEPTSAVEATRRLWADRCRRLLATLDAARAAHSPVQPVVGGLDVEALADAISGVFRDKRWMVVDVAKMRRLTALPEPDDSWFAAIGKMLGPKIGAALAATPEDQS